MAFIGPVYAVAQVPHYTVAQYSALPCMQLPAHFHKKMHFSMQFPEIMQQQFKNMQFPRPFCSFPSGNCICKQKKQIKCRKSGLVSLLPPQITTMHYYDNFTTMHYYDNHYHRLSPHITMTTLPACITMMNYHYGLQ